MPLHVSQPGHTRPLRDPGPSRRPHPILAWNASSDPPSSSATSPWGWPSVSSRAPWASPRSRPWSARRRRWREPASSSRLAVLASGAGVAAVLVATTIVNLRYVLFAATLSPYLHGVSTPKQAAIAFTLTDETFAVNIAEHRLGLSSPASMLGVGVHSLARLGARDASRAPGGPTGSETRPGSESASRCRRCSSRCSSRSPRTGVTW